MRIEKTMQWWYASKRFPKICKSIVILQQWIIFKNKKVENSLRGCHISSFLHIIMYWKFHYILHPNTNLEYFQSFFTCLLYCLQRWFIINMNIILLFRILTFSGWKLIYNFFIHYYFVENVVLWHRRMSWLHKITFSVLKFWYPKCQGFGKGLVIGREILPSKLVDSKCWDRIQSRPSTWPFGIFMVFFYPWKTLCK